MFGWVIVRGVCRIFIGLHGVFAAILRGNSGGRPTPVKTDEIEFMGVRYIRVDEYGNIVEKSFREPVVFEVRKSGLLRPLIWQARPERIKKDDYEAKPL